jgi:hypothetical protein
MVGLKMLGDEVTYRCPECGLTLYQPVSQCPRCLLLITPIPIPPSQPPMVESVYMPGLGERHPKEKKNLRRLFLIIFVIAIVACLIIVLSYNFIIPRLEFDVVTEYRESSGLSINVDSKIVNEGTLDIKHFVMNITVLNSSQGVVARVEHNASSIDSHSTEKFDNIHFFGDQYENYEIVIHIEFESSGKGYSKEYNHGVGKYMRVRWEDTYMKWGG